MKPSERGIIVTTIERAHEQLLNHRNAVPSDDNMAVQWIEGHDDIEKKIGHLDAEKLGDVLIKLEILYDRLGQASVCESDLFIAQSAKRDLTRLSFKYETSNQI